MNPEEIRNALKEVLDPELPINVIDMGLVKDIEVHGKTVGIKLTFTSTGCPCSDWIIDDIKAKLNEKFLVDDVRVDVVWNQPWNIQDMTDEGRLKLRESRIST
jgi:metal-sulfur cluster biosynthetic enzyme